MRCPAWRLLLVHFEADTPIMWERLRKFLVLVAFKTLAELRTERQRTYLGFLWWLFEPTFFMLVFYLVFGVLMKRGGPDFVPALLCGVIFWQWFGSCVMHSTTSIKSAMPLSRSVRLPMTLFPLSTLLADTIKFLFVLLVLVLVLTCLGHPPNMAYLALPAILATQFMLICGISFIVSALVPLVPDLRFVISPILQGVMFLSAVFYTFKSVSPGMRHWLSLNPMALIIESGRNLLLYGTVPDLHVLAIITLASTLTLAVGLLLVTRLSPVYPKLAD